MSAFKKLLHWHFVSKFSGSFRNISTSPKLINNVTINYNNLKTNNYLANRNPRNLERLRIARKPSGYHLDRPGKMFWHKVDLEKKHRYVIAKVYHNNGNVVVQASTNEWAISKHLYRANNLSSYIYLAQVLADRCLQCGLNYMINGINEDSSKKKEFIKHFEEGGVTLYEPPTYCPLTPWSFEVDEKSWKVHLD